MTELNSQSASTQDLTLLDLAIQQRIAVLVVRVLLEAIIKDSQEQTANELP